MSFSLHEEQKQSSHLMRDGLTLLKVICTIAGEWGNWTCELCGLVAFCLSQLQNVKTAVLKWMLLLNMDGNDDADSSVCTGIDCRHERGM
jgi:hypothetical protein